ncbi:MAG TPA: septal ring lytic transglycosylase RlpA family protein [Actinomycetota bacterium]|nr:septal ring lytic transglycosylase RlpA family protein [Actinomycetota bacterium]
MRALVERLRADVAAARARAEAAGRRVDRLERLLAELEEAEQAAWERMELLSGGTGADQGALLALLGPTGGRTCELPPGLRDTGQDVDGLASWYGWEFAGRTTASGAIFDPRLFTAAHRTLPFGVFLRVSYRGRCAIVLVNDRGPFIEGRVIDLSMAAARYLGVGVSPVHADVLVPR